jgi:hypothetical protein
MERLEAREVSKLKRPPAEPKPAKGPRTRKCKVCPNRFVPRSMMHNACGEECSKEVARLIREQRERKAAREDRANTRARKEAMKGYHELAAEAQKEFNGYVRFIQRDDPCISCGRHPRATHLTGGNFDAGHYRSVGSAPHLRFDPRNVNKQCKKCNRDMGGNHVEYRKRLVLRHGEAWVQELETDSTVAKWSHDDLRAIRDKYRKLLREAKKSADTTPSC